jgi:hypothetical protein
MQQLAAVAGVIDRAIALLEQAINGPGHALAYRHKLLAMSGLLDAQAEIRKAAQAQALSQPQADSRSVRASSAAASRTPD